MSSANGSRHISFALVAGLFTTHVAATALYLLPTNPLSAHYSAGVSSYIEPLFRQNWQLFAPEPATSSLKFLYRCSSSQQTGPWQDALAGLVQAHQNMRFSYRGKLIYVYQSLARNLLNHSVHLLKRHSCSGPRRDPKCLQRVRLELSSAKEFQRAQRFASDLCHGQRHSQWTTVQFQLVRAYAKNFSERLSSKPYGRLERLLFDPHPLTPQRKGSTR